MSYDKSEALTATKDFTIDGKVYTLGVWTLAIDGSDLLAMVHNGQGVWNKICEPNMIQGLGGYAGFFAKCLEEIRAVMAQRHASSGDEHLKEIENWIMGLTAQDIR